MKIPSAPELGNGGDFLWSLRFILLKSGLASGIRRFSCLSFFGFYVVQKTLCPSAIENSVTQKHYLSENPLRNENIEDAASAAVLWSWSMGGETSIISMYFI